MTRFTQHFAAAFAALLIVGTSFATVVTVPPAQATPIALTAMA